MHMPHSSQLLLFVYVTALMPPFPLSLQLFTRRAASLLFSNQRLQRWCFDVELVYLSEQLGIPLAEVCECVCCCGYKCMAESLA